MNKRMPLANKVFKGILLALLFALLVACGGGQEIPTGTNLYHDPNSAFNQAQPTDVVQENDNPWADNAWNEVQGVQRVELRGRPSDDGSGNAPVRYVRTDALPIAQETAVETQTEAANSPGIFDGLPWLFLVIVVFLSLVPGYFLRGFFISREAIRSYSGTTVEPKTKSRVEYDKVTWRIGWTLSTNPDDKDKYEQIGNDKGFISFIGPFIDDFIAIVLGEESLETGEQQLRKKAQSPFRYGLNRKVITETGIDPKSFIFTIQRVDDKDTGTPAKHAMREKGEAIGEIAKGAGFSPETAAAVWMVENGGLITALAAKFLINTPIGNMLGLNQATEGDTADKARHIEVEEVGAFPDDGGEENDE